MFDKYGPLSFLAATVLTVFLLDAGAVADAKVKQGKCVVSAYHIV